MKRFMTHLEKKDYMVVDHPAALLSTLAHNEIVEQVNVYIRKMDAVDLEHLHFTRLKKDIEIAAYLFNPDEGILTLKVISDSFIDLIRHCEYEI